ncbi:hypothetical protein RRG08_014570 [Elysia crispata]|uniref:DDE Tnp4 domain-containing protein n=1 Tax=Elysia crispata TaxID=231223 RepID=A0AAE1AUJ9_9GAST|nr:hypothetical protein RRG08_014570 [Elysia crispata]
MKSERFATLWNFPCCVGALDGKHVRIQCPSHAGSLFFNYKHFYSIQLQAVVDADLMFIVIDVGEYGRNSDGAAFKTSDFGKALMNKELDVPNPSLIPGTDEEMPYHFVADEAYPLNLNIMRPFDGRNLNNTRRVFNQRLSRALKVVECAFGILSRKWEIFQRPLRVQVDNAETIVKAACALHNFVRARDGEMRPETSTEMDTMEAPSLRQPAGLDLSKIIECLGHSRIPLNRNVHPKPLLIPPPKKEKYAQRPQIKDSAWWEQPKHITMHDFVAGLSRIQAARLANQPQYFMAP